jgi:hypothetical protein
VQSIAIPKLQQAWTFKATFEGDLPPKHYQSPNVLLSNPGWMDEHFRRPIEQLEFYLPTGHKILMRGFEQYNFFLEVAQDLGAGGRFAIDAVFLCGKLSGKPVVYRWRIGGGHCTQDRVRFGQEGLGMTPSRGWKRGVAGRISSLVVEG